VRWRARSLRASCAPVATAPSLPPSGLPLLREYPPPHRPPPASRHDGRATSCGARYAACDESRVTRQQRATNHASRDMRRDKPRITRHPTRQATHHATCGARQATHHATAARDKSRVTRRAARDKARVTRRAERDISRVTRQRPAKHHTSRDSDARQITHRASFDMRCTKNHARHATCIARQITCPRVKRHMSC
jgi:hypothetical protein